MSPLCCCSPWGRGKEGFGLSLEYLLAAPWALLGEKGINFGGMILPLQP